jgi:endo-1,4-beta-xylanase
MRIPFLTRHSSGGSRRPGRLVLEALESRLAAGDLSLGQVLGPSLWGPGLAVLGSAPSPFARNPGDALPAPHRRTGAGDGSRAWEGSASAPAYPRAGLPSPERQAERGRDSALNGASGRDSGDTSPRSVAPWAGAEEYWAAPFADNPFPGPARAEHPRHAVHAGAEATSHVDAGAGLTPSVWGGQVSHPPAAADGGPAARPGVPGGTPLRDLADQRGLWVGPAVAYGPLVNEPPYAQTLAREFNVVTAENAMKWAATQPQRYKYTFGQADTIVNFALANGMAVHGHNLVWDQDNPSWLTSGNFSRDEMIAILRDHIDTVAGRYSGSVAFWDVVNEAVGPDGSLRNTIWMNRIGPDYLDLAFQFASEADPYALLVYNDYGAEVMNAKSNGIYDLVSGMLSRGVPIHGVGFQTHVDLNGIDYQSFAQNLQRFADLGLAVFVTEMDVRIPLPATPDKLARQAEVYRNVLDVCLGQPACYGFQTWGFTDKYSWIPGSFPGYGAALIFDKGYNPKPDYDALEAELMG